MEVPGTLELCLENPNDENIHFCLLIPLNRPFRTNGQWTIFISESPEDGVIADKD